MKFGVKNYSKTVNKLLCSIKRGDKRKMDDLFDVTFNHFYGYAFTRLHDRSKAEDAVMTMYERVLRYIDKFDSKKDGTGWMFSILKNTIYTMNSEEKKKRTFELPIADNDNPNGLYEAVAVSDIDEMYNSLEMMQIIEEMDEIDRRITYLYYFERMSLREISNELKLSKSTIHYRKERIVKIFKKFLS